MKKYLLSKHDVGRGRLFLHALTKLGRKHGFKIVGMPTLESMDQADIRPLYVLDQDQETGDYRMVFDPASALAHCVDALNRAGSELVCQICLDGRMIEKPNMCPTVEVVSDTICADCQHTSGIGEVGELGLTQRRRIHDLKNRKVTVVVLLRVATSGAAGDRRTRNPACHAQM